MLSGTLIRTCNKRMGKPKITWYVIGVQVDVDVDLAIN